MRGQEDVGSILDVLGNETRRRILQLLANESRYFNELSRELRVSQQAVLKHLDILAEHGLITSYRAKSDLGAPDRKYYRLAKSVHLSVGITGDTIGIGMREIPDESNEHLRSGAVEVFRKELEELQRARTPDDVLSAGERLLSDVDRHILGLEDEQVALLGIRQAIMEEVHSAVRETEASPLERRIVFSLLRTARRIPASDLCEEFDVTERRLQDSMNRLQTLFANSFRRLASRVEID